MSRQWKSLYLLQLDLTLGLHCSASLSVIISWLLPKLSLSKKICNCFSRHSSTSPWCCSLAACSFSQNLCSMTCQPVSFPIWLRKLCRKNAKIIFFGGTSNNTLKASYLGRIVPPCTQSYSVRNGSRSTMTLTRIKWLLAMHEQMNGYNFLTSGFFASLEDCTIHCVLC